MAAETLEPDHPAAASILCRVLIDDTLDRARSSAHGHACQVSGKTPCACYALRCCRLD
ncbi:DUF6880 family protein [Methylocapsa polymorpha]|uniref:DUF6880 family protein n=1 Tax=Methylocapsa polymorpha TaxID=3080828 RepID=UPI003890F24C